MRDDERELDAEWTPSERARLNALPRERAPSDTLRARTLSELRHRALVRRGNHSRLRKAAWIAIAASMMFVAGGIVGYRVAITRLEARLRLATIASDASNPPATTGHVVWF